MLISAKASDLRRGLLATLAAVAVVGGTASVVQLHEGYIPIPEGCCQDHQHYLAMAGEPLGQPAAGHAPPFAYRLLSPLIVRTLPFKPTVGFHVLTMTSLGVTAFLIFYVLKSMDFGDASAVGGTLLFGSLYWAVEFTQMDFALVDPLSFTLFAATILTLYRKAPTPLIAGLLALAVANKEVGLLLVPVAIVVLLRTRSCTISKAVLLCAGPVLMFLLLRIIVPVRGDDDLWTVFRTSFTTRFGSGVSLWDEMETYFLPTWGPLLLVPLLQPQSLVRFVRRFPELLALYILVHTQLLFATDTSRLLIIGYIAVLPAVVYCVREALRRDWLVLLVAILMAAIQGFYFEFLRQSVARFANARDSFDPAIIRLETEMTFLMLAIAAVLALRVWLDTSRRPGGIRQPTPSRPRA